MLREYAEEIEKLRAMVERGGGGDFVPNEEVSCDWPAGYNTRLWLVSCPQYSALIGSGSGGGAEEDPGRVRERDAGDEGEVRQRAEEQGQDGGRGEEINKKYFNWVQKYFVFPNTILSSWFLNATQGKNIWMQL